MKIEQIRTFATVAGLRSVSKAARQLSLSQSAVSHQILAMETELNFDLFLHEGRKCQLTDAGELFLERVAPIVYMYQSAVEDVRDQLGIASSTNELTVVYPPECNPNVCAKLAETYWTTNPHMLVTFIATESAEQAFKGVRDRVADVAMGIESPLMQETGLVFRPIQDVRECCIVEGQSRLASLERVTPADLDGVFVSFMFRKGTFVGEDAIRDQLPRLQPGAIIREPASIGGIRLRTSSKDIEHVIIAPQACVNTNSSTRRFLPFEFAPVRFGIVSRLDAGSRARDFIERLAQYYCAHPDEPVV